MKNYSEPCELTEGPMLKHCKTHNSTATYYATTCTMFNANSVTA